jgi:hypothetical protein
MLSAQDLEPKPSVRSDLGMLVAKETIVTPIKVEDR